MRKSGQDFICTLSGEKKSRCAALTTAHRRIDDKTDRHLSKCPQRETAFAPDFRSPPSDNSVPDTLYVKACHHFTPPVQNVKRLAEPRPAKHASL